MIDEHLASACGIYCGDCEYLYLQCPGCGNIQGKPFWTHEIDLEVCPLYQCCINLRNLEHCGHCEDLPCATFTDFHDPSLTPEEAERSVSERRMALLRRKEIGTARWLEERLRPKNLD